MRITGGTSNTGRVEIQHQGVWGTICDDHWNIVDARVVCRQLGFATATAAHQGSNVVDGTGHVWMDDIRCIGTERRLQDCPSQPFGNHNCGHHEDAEATCSSNIIPYTVINILVKQSCHYCIVVTDTVRITGGTTSNTGRVEIRHQGVWGTICDDYWGIIDAQVVCRQLGFATATAAHQGSNGLDGTGQIWMDDITCTGTETSLQDCPSQTIGNHNCGHHEDAGVTCSSI